MRIEKDWRTGVKVTPKLRTHPHFGCVAVVLSAHESGTSNLFDKDGILLIEVKDGPIFFARADEWKTA